MKKITRQIILSLFLTGFCLPGSLLAEKKTAETPLQEIRLGERLVYKISWLRIPVGMGVLHVKEKINMNGREVFHVIGKIETNKVLSKIFPIHDEAHSWIDAKSFESVQFEKKIDELIIKAHEKMVFDSSAHKGYFESLKTGEKKEFKIPVPVYDVLGAFFWARRQTLVPGKSVKTVLTADQKHWQLEIHGLRREKVKLDGAKIQTLRVEPTTVVEGEEKKGKAWFNVTLDGSQTPVRIVYKAPIGRITGTLIESEPDRLEKA